MVCFAFDQAGKGHLLGDDLILDLLLEPCQLLSQVALTLVQGLLNFLQLHFLVQLGLEVLLNGQHFLERAAVDYVFLHFIRVVS